MASVQQSVLVPYRAAQMFALVERIEDYPRLLPWGGAPPSWSERRRQRWHESRSIFAARAHFTTADRGQRPQRIVIEPGDGPFRQLDGTWQIRALTMSASKVEFELHYVLCQGSSSG